MVNLSLADSNSDRDSDTLGSLPMVGGPGAPWGMGNRAGAPAHGFTPFNQYNSGGGGPIPQAAVPPMPHHPVQMNPGNPMVRGTANAVLDYTVPPPAYTGGTSDIESKLHQYCVPVCSLLQVSLLIVEWIEYDECIFLSTDSPKCASCKDVSKLIFNKQNRFFILYCDDCGRATHNKYQILHSHFYSHR